MRLSSVVWPLAVGTVIAGLIYAPAVIPLPPWADALRVQLASATALGAVVAAASGRGDVRVFFGTLCLIAALFVQGSLSSWVCGAPIVEYGYGLTMIIGPAVFFVFPWLGLVAVLAAAAVAYAVLQRLSPAYRALAAALVLIAMTGASSLLSAHVPPAVSGRCDF